jgi:hypothetical protein
MPGHRHPPPSATSRAPTPATRWIEPLIPDSPAAPMHPNALGERGIADAVLHAITATA